MASQVNPPRGMRDFLPTEKAHRERVLGIIRETYRGHGFEEIETPVMEDSDRLHAGLGGDNEKLAYGVMKRGLGPDDFHAANDVLDLVDLGLRFDLTVPLARFYASHRAELPTVFKAIQLAPVWRAERPQKGRYRQFVQCDIDIIGEAGILAEVELLAATLATLDALGLDDCGVRINDRRLLTGMLDALGFPATEHASVLITVDKLDKLGKGGVIAELRDRGFPAGPVDALEGLLAQAETDSPLTTASILAQLPEGADEVVVAELAAIGQALGSAAGEASPLTFDPFLVRGMGYYTGTIFEVTHPDFDYSLGGGGRYDGMIGRFLGTEVPAAGFSFGFERIVDLVSSSTAELGEAIAIVFDPEIDPSQLIATKREWLALGARVRLERRPKNMKPLLEQLAHAGVDRYALLTAEGLGDFKLLTQDE
jgi:histidyl-tRNA synthetase